jgi:hypothetical protein
MNNNRTLLSRYTQKSCDSLQTWSSKDAAVMAFGMRPLINSKEYFNTIRAYLSNLVLNDVNKIISFSKDKYQLVDPNGQEPYASFLETIKRDLVSKLNVLMSNTSSEVSFFKDYNPLSEGFVITDVKITTYISLTNKNNFYHTFTFGAVNTTRYNTISFKGSVYQDTSNIIEPWNKSVTKVVNSEDYTCLKKPGENLICKGSNNNTEVTSIYFNELDFLNNISCVIGDEDTCNFKPFESDLPYGNADGCEKSVNWFKQGSLENSTFDKNGLYSSLGDVKILDKGPPDYENLVKEMADYY